MYHLDNTVPLDLVTEGMLKLEDLIQMHFALYAVK